MNKAVIGVIVALIVASGAFVLLSGGDDEMTESTNQTTQTTNQSQAPAAAGDDADQETEAMRQSIEEAEQREADAEPAATDSSSDAGSYVEYTGSEIADASGTKRVLFFHAEWCGVCNFFEDDIKTTGVPDGVTIIEADFDKDTALKQQYGVSVQSTFIVLDDSGNAVQTWPFASGLQDANDLFAQI